MVVEHLSEVSHQAQPAPQGFSLEQWAEFCDRGIIEIEDALSPDQVGEAIEVIDRVAKASGYDGSNSYSRPNAVTVDPLFESFVDHPAHIGFAYDIYGEQTKAHLTQFMIRPKGGWHNLWHPDGARATPYGVFSPILPLQIKVSYWLTDVPEAKMGNLVVLPGSHRHQYMDGYDTHESMEGEYIVKPKAGTLTIMHSSIWHRVEPNESDVERKNIFYAYCPSWVVAEDHYTYDEAFVQGLSRERRTLLRSYAWPYDCAKPKPSEFPLYLDRETGADHDAQCYREHVELHRRKRKTWVEKYGMDIARQYMT